MNLSLSTDGSTRQHIVFVASNIDDFEHLLGALPEGAEVHVVDAGKDGLGQMAAVLAGRTGVAAVHVVGHGSSGMLQLGSTSLDINNIGEHAASLDAIKASLAPGADLLLYGCSIGLGERGTALLEVLHQQTGADIAASTDATGATQLGGDWTLERTVGDVDSMVIFSESAAQRFQGLLAVPADENFNSYPVDPFPTPSQPTPRTIGGFIFTADQPTSAWLIDNDSYSMTVGDGTSLYINSEGIALNYIEIRASSLADNFKLVSLMFETYGTGDGGSDTLTITGYDDGVQVASDALQVFTDDSGGSISFDSLNFTAGGVLSFGAGWQNIDTIRIAAAPGRVPVLFLDNIDISAAVVPPAIGNSSYDAATGVLTVNTTGTIGAVDPTKLTLTGEGGSSVTLSASSVATTGSGSFTITLSAADKLAINGLLNKDGASAASGTVYNIAGAANWTAGANADSTGNGITVASVQAPTITSASYDSGTNVLTVTGTNLVARSGATNDITVSKLTVTGEGGQTYTLTTSDVEVTSATSFSVTLSAADQAAVEQIFNKGGTSSTGGTTYNIAAAEDWNGTVYGNTADATSGLTVSNVPEPTITSATYDVATGILTVTGTGLVSLAGSANDIIGSKFTVMGDPSRGYNLENAPSVEITSDTSFTIQLSEADRVGVSYVFTKNGTAAAGGTNYNLIVDGDWAAGAPVSSADWELDNGITVTNVVTPTATIAMSDTALLAGETSTVTFTFSENVTGFSNDDLTVDGGSLSAVSSSDGGRTWTATFTPDAGTIDDVNTISLNNAGVANSKGAPGTGTTSSANYTLDTKRPTASVNMTDSMLLAGETSDFTITFNRAVTGLTNDDLTLAGGTLTPLVTSDGVTWTATFTPTPGLFGWAHVITLDLGGVTDASGNAGAGSTNSNNYVIDTIRPSAEITVADSVLTSGETTQVTIKFNEEVSGFDASDITVANGTLSGLATSDGGTTWTATLTPTDMISDATNVISVNNTGVTDAFGNAGSGNSDSHNYAVQTAGPSATITLADTTLKSGETSLVTIVFTEAVTGFANDDLTVEGGTLSAVSSSDGGTTWTATFTPSADLDDTSNIITLDNTGVTGGSAGVGTSASGNYTIDTKLPTAEIAMADSALKLGDASQVTITFSEAVTGFTNDDLTLAGGTLSAVTSSDGGVTWTATFAPSSDLEDTSNVITLNNSGVQDASGNAGTGTTSSANYTVDTLRPTATIVIADTALKAGETSLVTITFSEAVSGFGNGDLVVEGGTLSPVASSDGGITWTATLTPGVNVEDTSNSITLNNTGVTDLSGNAGVSSTISNNYALDTLRPTATITVADTALNAGETSLVTLTFSEAVTGLTAGDLTVANGSINSLSTSDGGLTWTGTLTPTADTTDASNTITLDNTGVQDASGNTGTGTTASNNYAIDTMRPTAAIVVADDALKAGETSVVTITFSETVIGLTSADLTMENGALDHITSTDGGLTWTATLTPTADLTDTSNVITLDNTGVADAAGNAGAGTTTSNHYAIDSKLPTATISVADSALSAGETTQVTITFSEAVTGLSLADLTAQNGNLADLASSDGGVTWTATLTPVADLADTTNVITLDNSGVMDLAGNAGVGTANSTNYVVQTQRPTASIVVADTALRAGETSTVTITFSEAVTGFTNADLTAANGTLGDVSSSDGGVTWSATFTPTADVTDTTNVITLDNTGVQNSAGNAGSGTTASNNYAIDTLRPTATIVVADDALKAGETSAVTITFSEAVTGLAPEDLTVENGTLEHLTTTDGGLTWTATLTPTADLTDTSNVITLDNTGVADAAGNTGAGTTTSNHYAIDGKRPGATITLADSALNAGETTTVTIAFTEAVTGFANDDLTVVGGTLGAVSSADGGLTWTATFTPTAGISTTGNVVTLNQAGVTDAAGNAGTGNAQSGAYSVLTVRPTATIAIADTALKAGETTTVTITFSEAVTGLTTADITAANGALNALSSTDGGVTWTGTITPAANVSSTTNVITLDMSGIANASGNAGTGSIQTGNYAIDTARPGATITLGDSQLVEGGSTTVTITFTEAVTGFDLADVVAEGGTLSGLASTDGGRTWTAQYTADGESSSNVIRVQTAGVTDAAGNAGNTEAVSSTFDIVRDTIDIDGVPATSTTQTDPTTGIVTETISVPVITETRVDDPDTPNSGLADIPLAVNPTSGSGPATGLTASLPVGVGLQANGPSSLLSGENALIDLIRRIESRTEANTPVQTEMKGQGSSFLDTLEASAKLETRTLVLQSTGSQGAQPIQVTAAPSQAGLAVALVIDTKQTPSGTVLQLDNIEFAAIVGSATLRGGEGRNYVIGDSASQNIFLGADDDNLHGGAGDDVVGSAGGNDVVDGGDGQDIVVGGIGHDIVVGGSGNDMLSGGRSDVGQWQFFIDANGQVSARHETAVFAPGSWENVAVSELDGSAQWLGFLGASGAKLQELALLYQGAFGRAPDLAGLEFWAQNGGSASEVMAMFAAGSEYGSGSYAGLTNEAFVRAVYSNMLGRAADDSGVAFWTGKLAAATPLARSDMLAAFALSAEHRAHVSNDGVLTLATGAVTQQAQWFSGSGDDVLDGGAGNDEITGGDGLDTVVYVGPVGQYRILLGEDGQVRIADSVSGDVDVVSGIERARFGSLELNLGFTQASTESLQSLGLLYQTLFDRAGDIGGFNWWLSLGGDTLQLATWMTGSAEFTTRYAGTSDIAFVNALYANTGISANAAGGAAHWVDYLHTHTRAEMIAEWVAQAEVVGAHYGDDGIWLV